MVNKLNIDILRWVFRAWRYRLKVEKQEINFMLSHLKPGQTAIDIGAHKGAYTYWMSKYVGKDGKFLSKEEEKDPNIEKRTPYRTNKEHIQEFIGFLKSCGGFRVC